MAEFWDFLIVLVAFVFLAKIVSTIVTKGQDQKAPKRTSKMHRELEETEGFLVGGLVCLFMGVAMYYSTTITQLPSALGPIVVMGGFVLAAIGFALLIAYVILKAMRQF
jgi:mannose/fructose/N-acetylgalactosamine-specific phosphotransferase system component IIC